MRLSPNGPSVKPRLSRRPRLPAPMNPDRNDLRAPLHQLAAQLIYQFTQRHASLPKWSISKAPALPPAASSSADESTTTGQDSAESTPQSPPCTTAFPPEYPHSHRPSSESQPPAQNAAHSEIGR